MSRIFIVQPSKMLQQAFAFALASEHEIRVTDKLPESEPAPVADLAIVDAGALPQGDAPAARQRSLIRNWQMPIIWIGPEAPPAESAPRKFVRIEPPLDRESLKRAVADCLSQTEVEQPATTKRKLAAAAVSTETQSQKSQSGSVASNDIIELVEVVAEEAAHEMPDTDAREKS